MVKSMKWHLVDNGDGTFDVEKRGRRVLTAVPRDRAIRYLKNYPANGERIYEREPDGYETRLRNLS